MYRFHQKYDMSVIAKILNEEEIDVIEGFIFTKRNIVPIERLHKIAVMKGPIDRAFGLAKVVVTTAGGTLL